jgi:hypothetical protein
MLRASLGKVVHTVQRAGTFAAKVSPQELHKIAVHVRAVVSIPHRQTKAVSTGLWIILYIFYRLNAEKYRELAHRMVDIGKYCVF